MADPAHVAGFHIVSPSAGREFPHDTIAGIVAGAIGEPVDIKTDIRPGWTKLIVRISREQLTTHGAPALDALFESVCGAAGAHFARTFGMDEWALVEDGELAGAINALDWLQYFGPRFGDWLGRRKSQWVTSRNTAGGAQIVTVAIDPLSESWVTRQDAARDLSINLRPLPAVAQSEVDPQARLQQALPPEPVKWEKRQRVAMFDARVGTMKVIEAGMANASFFDRFRQSYLPDKLDEPLLDRIATWLPHYGAEATATAFRSVARLHFAAPGAAPLDPIALEGCVKLVSWGGDDLSLASRELLLEHIVSLADPGNARFARDAYEPAVIQGMLKLTAALMRDCPCARCQSARSVPR
jgi:hypothetical protein